KLEEQESRPAPGYDADGNELGVPEFAFDEEGRFHIPGHVVVDGDVYLGGDVDNDYEPENPAVVPRSGKVKFIEVTEAEEVADDRNDRNDRDDREDADDDGNDAGLGQRRD